MTTAEREGWGHPVPGRCPRCGGLNLAPPADHPGQDATQTWRCRDCGERATSEQIAAAAGGGPSVGASAAGTRWS